MGFVTDRLTDGQTNICVSRVAFTPENAMSPMFTKSNLGKDFGPKFTLNLQNGN